LSILLNDEQLLAINKLTEWIRDFKVYNTQGKKYLLQAVSGSAGTGKTTLIISLIDNLKKYLKKNIAVVSYTGKASSVIAKKLNENNIINITKYVGTIHGLIYEPIYDFDPLTRKIYIKEWIKKQYLDNIDVIIVDEASMVSNVIWRDLLEYDKPIIAVGDNNQLPPIENNYTTNIYSKILYNPDYILTKIQRQAENDPIIKAALSAKDYGKVEYGKHSENVFRIEWKHKICQELFNSIEFDKETIVLCGINKTRVQLNKNIRKRFKYTDDYPYPGERVICIKNNTAQKLMNGQLGTLQWVFPKNDILYSLSLYIDDREDLYSTLALKDSFNQEKYDIWNLGDKKPLYRNGWKTIDYFDYGYAISVHKSQGSEWDRVVVFEQRPPAWDDDYYRRWLYTAVTRAKKKLFIITDYWD